MWDFMKRSKASSKQSSGNVSNSPEQSPQHTSQTSSDSVISTEQQSQAGVANAVAVQSASDNNVSVSSTIPSSTIPSTKSANQESSKKLKRGFHSIETLLSPNDTFKRKKSIDDVRSLSIEIISNPEPSPSSNQQQQPSQTSSTFSFSASKPTVLSPLAQMVQGFNFRGVGGQSSSNKSSPHQNKKSSCNTTSTGMPGLDYRKKYGSMTSAQSDSGYSSVSSGQLSDVSVNAQLLPIQQHRNTTSTDMSSFDYRNNYGSVTSAQSDSGYSSVSSGQLSDVSVNAQLLIQNQQFVNFLAQQIRSQVLLGAYPYPQTVLQQHVPPLQNPNINLPLPKQMLNALFTCQQQPQAIDTTCLAQLLSGIQVNPRLKGNLTSQQYNQLDFFHPIVPLIQPKGVEDQFIFGHPLEIPSATSPEQPSSESSPPDPSPSGKFVCEWDSCHEVFDSGQHFIDHIASHVQNQQSNVCLWRRCERKKKPFAAHYMLILHVRKHSGEKPNRCPICDKGYSRRENLKTHMRTHTGEKPYRCEYCPKAFSNASDRAKHQNRTHSDARPYTCPVENCDKCYTDPSSLRKHIKTQHGDEIYEIAKTNKAKNGRGGSYGFIPDPYDEARDKKEDDTANEPGPSGFVCPQITEDDENRSSNPENSSPTEASSSIEQPSSLSLKQSPDSPFTDQQSGSSSGDQTSSQQSDSSSGDQTSSADQYSSSNQPNNNNPSRQNRSLDSIVDRFKAFGVVSSSSRCGANSSSFCSSLSGRAPLSFEEVKFESDFSNLAPTVFGDIDGVNEEKGLAGVQLQAWHVCNLLKNRAPMNLEPNPFSESPDDQLDSPNSPNHSFDYLPPE